MTRRPVGEEVEKVVVGEVVGAEVVGGEVVGAEVVGAEVVGGGSHVETACRMGIKTQWQPLNILV